MRVFVLLFNTGTENEGIHTLKDLRSERNKVLMFESEDDATRFGVLLEAQDFFNPSVESVDSEEVKEFCRSADYDWEIVPEGALAVPPETNVDQTDWQKEQRREAGEMSQSELDRIRRQLEGLL
ncbi:DUF3110 domain-containing protein [Ancylothrix sp. C2]|uniref:DUF3110 domain-containing protein n=1 Tax=Ancylothrix sp. D3o TaxID=2953691 RepID=UPI0021BB8AB6|nr:DUF3110 domain-containing protein [Ancylothrix sp. D3o]MCT7949534.1 DUF3110 domain-containing protein [Ancylothrix sp. D3o]